MDEIDDRQIREAREALEDERAERCQMEILKIKSSQREIDEMPIFCISELAKIEKVIAHFKTWIVDKMAIVE
jgi:hypothetical protein